MMNQIEHIKKNNKSRWTTWRSCNGPADLMLEVRLKEADDFLKVRETLSRIGVASRKGEKVIPIMSYLA